MRTEGDAPACPVQAAGAGLDGALDQLGDIDLFEEDVARARVDPRHLEQVADHPLEAAQVVAQESQRLTRTRGKVVLLRFEHLERRRQGGQGRAQLMAHVGVEAGLPLDAHLELIDHGVEGVGQSLEVGVGRVGVEARVELASRDGAGGPRHVGQGAQEPAAGEAAQGGAEQRGDDAGDEERDAEDAQRVIEVGQVEDLEVVGLDRRDGHAHGDLGRAVGRPVGLGGRVPGHHLAAERLGDGRGTHRERRRVGLALVEEHRVGVRPGVDVGQQRHVLVVVGLQGAAHHTGVGEGLTLRRRLAPGQQEVPRREVGEAAHEDGEQEGADPEDSRDPGPDAQSHVRAPACSPCPSR